MSLLRLTGVTRYYGGEHIFGPVDLMVNPGERIGLIGPNGSGKSSLLDILADTAPDDGHVHRARNLEIGYLRQEGAESSSATLYSYVMEAFARLDTQEQKLRELEQRIASPEAQHDGELLDSLMNTYAAQLSAFEEGGGYEREARCRGTLFGLGFSEEELDRPFVSLSGGERARAQLARLLLTPADLLLLDEPTNHLDLTSTEWLQNFLNRDSRAFILVSHDRHLLDALVTTIWEVEDRSIYSYPGNYTASRQQAVLRREQILKEYHRDQEERERLEAFVRKWGAGTRASQAKSRARRLAKMGDPLAKPSEEVKAHFTVPLGNRSERRVCTLDGLSVGYDNTPLLADVDLEIVRGDRIGIVGANGSGKSTLLRTIAGAMDPLVGTVDVGRGVQIAYFSQHRVDLDPDRTVLDEALEGQDWLIGQARSLLARFLFRGDDVFKSVGVLSGGEKSRLALTKALFQGGNFLLLDEPTNHLDVQMVEALEEALADYAGTLLFITHDRAFLQELAHTIWWIEDGRVHVVEGGYDALQTWMEKRGQARQTGADLEEKPSKARSARSLSGSKKKPQRTNPYILRQTEAELQEVESSIENLQARKVELERMLAEPGTYRQGDRARELTAEHREVCEALAHQEDLWTEIMERLEFLAEG